MKENNVQKQVAQRSSWYIPRMNKARHIWGWESKQGGGKGDTGEFGGSDQEL